MYSRWSHGIVSTNDMVMTENYSQPDEQANIEWSLSGQAIIILSFVWIVDEVVHSYIMNHFCDTKDLIVTNRCKILALPNYIDHERSSQMIHILKIMCAFVTAPTKQYINTIDHYAFYFASHVVQH